MKKEVIGTIIGIITLISLSFGVYFWMDNRYASSEDVQEVQQFVQQVDQRLDYKIKDDQYKATRDRVYDMKEKYGETPEDTTLRKRLMELEDELRMLDDQLKKMQTTN